MALYIAPYLIVMKRNIPLLGFFIGAVLPLLGMVIVYFILFRNASFGDFFRGLLNDKQVAAKVLSLSLLLNIIPFIFYTNKRLDLTARGILVATMLYFLVFVLLKFVL
jgi:hypothetical protein